MTFPGAEHPALKQIGKEARQYGVDLNEAAYTDPQWRTRMVGAVWQKISH